MKPWQEEEEEKQKEDEEEERKKEEREGREEQRKKEDNNDKIKTLPPGTLAQLFKALVSNLPRVTVSVLIRHLKEKEKQMSLRMS